MQPNSVKDKYAVAIFQEGKEKVIGHHHHDHNEFISAYPFYMKLALRQKIIYTKKK